MSRCLLVLVPQYFHGFLDSFIPWRTNKPVLRHPTACMRSRLEAPHCVACPDCTRVDRPRFVAAREQKRGSRVLRFHCYLTSKRALIRGGFMHAPDSNFLGKSCPPPYSAALPERTEGRQAGRQVLKMAALFSAKRRVASRYHEAPRTATS